MFVDLNWTIPINYNFCIKVMHYLGKFALQIFFYSLLFILAYLQLSFVHSIGQGHDCEYFVNGDIETLSSFRNYYMIFLFAFVHLDVSLWLILRVKVKIMHSSTNIS